MLVRAGKMGRWCKRRANKKPACISRGERLGLETRRLLNSNLLSNHARAGVSLSPAVGI